MIKSEKKEYIYKLIAILNSHIETLSKKGNNMSEEVSKEQNAKQFMEQVVKKNKIFMDTCSIIIAENSFWDHITPYLKQYKKKVIIPSRCCEELEKKSNEVHNTELAKTARERLSFIKKLSEKGVVEFRGETTDNFADNVFMSVFTKFRLKYDLLLITQDNNLANDILNLNNIKSQKSNYTISVHKVNKYNYFGNFYLNKADQIEKKQKEKKDTSKKNSEQKIQNQEIIPPEEIFKLCTKPTTISDDILSVSHIPTEHEQVYSERGIIQLRKKIASGGEGILYETNTPFVAKIYFKDKNTKRRVKKITLMLSKRINCEGICYPIEALYNSNKQFVGYLMPKAYGKELQKSLFIKPIFLERFPDWKKKDTVKLCITILKKIKYLHDRNIILGDINPNNIMIESPEKVYFVDTDSYQIENFPCPVGTINFTAPEIQKKPYNEFLRTIGNENFAIATLLFMIMLPGKPPYSQQGGDNPIDNIINMDFSYPFGGNTNKKTPEGPWRYIWSHLPYDIKEAFYKTFRMSEDYSTEKTRLDVNDWIPLFEHYYEILNSGKVGVRDKMSEELFPTRFKKNSKERYIVCRLCHNEMPAAQSKNGICNNCLTQGEEYLCERCKQPIRYTNYAKYIKGTTKIYRFCKDCSDYLNAVHEYITCIDCNKTFPITNGQYEFLKEKGYSLPKRCKSCKENKKNTNISSNLRSHIPDSSNSHSSSGLLDCFITTTVCEYLGKPDDCDELTILRHYRDSWLRIQPDGPALIAEYYEKGPMIVKSLKESEMYSEYCQILYDKYLIPCIKLIKKEKNIECLNLYKKMIADISNLLFA